MRSYRSVAGYRRRRRRTSLAVIRCNKRLCAHAVAFTRVEGVKISVTASGPPTASIASASSAGTIWRPAPLPRRVQHDGLPKQAYLSRDLGQVGACSQQSVLRPYRQYYQDGLHVHRDWLYNSDMNKGNGAHRQVPPLRAHAIRSAKSVAGQYGPRLRARRSASPRSMRPSAARSALRSTRPARFIADGGLIPTTGRGVFRSVSSNGTDLPDPQRGMQLPGRLGTACTASTSPPRASSPQPERHDGECQLPPHPHDAAPRHPPGPDREAPGSGTSGKHHALTARPATRRPDRLLSPTLTPTTASIPAGAPAYRGMSVEITGSKIRSATMETADQIRNRIDSPTVDDAIIAAAPPAILAEISAGHEEFADRLASTGRLAADQRRASRFVRPLRRGGRHARRRPVR